MAANCDCHVYLFTEVDLILIFIVCGYATESDSPKTGQPVRAYDGNPLLSDQCSCCCFGENLGVVVAMKMCSNTRGGRD